MGMAYTARKPQLWKATVPKSSVRAFVRTRHGLLALVWPADYLLLDFKPRYLKLIAETWERGLINRSSESLTNVD